jgi:16S rRNA (adenine1518-N6/adenine1519-N6)-dimethyltransferase
LSLPDPPRQTRSHLTRLFQQHGLRPKFELGQNFLIDLNIIEFVVREAELTSADLVLEVGTGTGGMTAFLAREAGHVITADVDRDMHRLAASVLQPYNNVTLITGDALHNKNRLADELLTAIQAQLSLQAEPRLKLVANLPYSIATPVISNLVATELPWVGMVVTIQHEVGLRMQAAPGSEFYGALSIWLQAQCSVTLLKKLGPTVFWPAPKVDSAVMRILPDPLARGKIADRAFFHDYLRRVFSLRRKLLKGVLHGMYSEQLTKPQVQELMAAQGLSETTRAEEMSVSQHVELANQLQRATHQQ